jgi:hypothetical protein
VLEEALEKARVTFLDFKVALYPLRHPLLTEAAAIAESYCSAALAADVPVDKEGIDG